jgi:hypothetical protein
MARTLQVAGYRAKWLAIEGPLLGHHSIFDGVVHLWHWYIYGTTRHVAERPTSYLATSAYIWDVLTPIVLWLVRRYPISAAVWRFTVPIHIVASVALTVPATFFGSAWRIVTARARMFSSRRASASLYAAHAAQLHGVLGHTCRRSYIQALRSLTSPGTACSGAFTG